MEKHPLGIAKSHNLRQAYLSDMSVNQLVKLISSDAREKCGIQEDAVLAEVVRARLADKTRPPNEAAALEKALANVANILVAKRFYNDWLGRQSPVQLAQLRAPSMDLQDLVTGKNQARLLEWVLRSPVRNPRWNSLIFSWALPSNGEQRPEEEIALVLLADDITEDQTISLWLMKLRQGGRLGSRYADARIERFPREYEQWEDLLSPMGRACGLWRAGQYKEARACVEDDDVWRFVERLLRQHTVTVDIESDGTDIWQVGIVENGSGKLIFDQSDPVHGDLSDALVGLERRIDEGCLVIGHNLLSWDWPILRKKRPGLPEQPWVWDTLLVSYLREPWKRSHALGGCHNAALDAADTFALFVEQARGFGAETMLGLLQRQVSGTGDLLQALCRNVLGAEVAPPSSPRWLMDVVSTFPRAGLKERLVVPGALLDVVAWVPGVRVVPAPGHSAVEAEALEIEPVASQESEEATAASSLHVLVVAGIVQLAHRNLVQFRIGMVPLWLRESPGVEAWLTAHAQVPQVQAGVVNVMRYPGESNWYQSEEAKAARISAPLFPALVVDDAWHPGARLRENPSTEVNDIPDAPTLFSLRERDGSAAIRQWIFFDPVRHRLNRSGIAWRKFSTLAVDNLQDASVAVASGPAWKPRLVDWGQRRYLYPTTADQRAYWIDVLEQLKAIPITPRCVRLLLITSCTELKLLPLLEEALVILKLSTTRLDHWSRAECLRRAAALDGGGGCLVDFVEALPTWSEMASSAGIQIIPVIEALPLHDWWARCHAARENDDDNDTLDPSLLDEEDGEEDQEDGTSEDDDDLGGRAAALELTPISNARVIQNARKLVDECLAGWLSEIAAGCTEPAFVLDPRLTPRSMKGMFDVLRHMGVDTASADMQAVGRILEPLGKLPREIPSDEYEPLRAFLEAHWSKDDGTPIEDFRPVTQQPAIEVIRKRDADILVTLSTGEGKSVLFQVPALYRGMKNRRLTLVISPLRALMRDQVERLRAAKFHQSVDYLSADRPQHETEDVLQGILDHRIVLLYIAPERFRNQVFIDVLDRRYKQDDGFEYLVVDEAHCVSQWGYEFRPDYFYAMRIMCERYRHISADGTEKSQKTPFVLLSATVTASIRADLERLTAGVGNNERYMPFVSRPGKYFHPIRDHISIKTPVVMGRITGKKQDWQLKPRIDEILGQINQAIEVQKNKGQKSGVIVFVGRRGHAEELAYQLGQVLEAGQVDYYHAGLDAMAREEVYTRFLSGNIQVLVATKAFGMGMDIPHIHWAVHLAPPAYLEDYLQEVGRIGRGEKARKDAGLDRLNAILLHSADDFQTNHSNIQRDRIDVPQIVELWEQIIRDAHELKGGFVTVMPEAGFKEYNTFSARRAGSTSIRKRLHWLDRMGRVNIVQMMPGLLQVQVIPSILQRQSEQGDPNLVAICGVLMALASTQDTPGGPQQVNNRPVDEAGQPISFVESLVNSISKFFGFAFGGESKVAAGDLSAQTVSSPVNTMEPVGAKTQKVGSTGIDVVVNIAQLWRITSYKVANDVLAAISALQKSGGLKIVRKISFGSSRLSKRLESSKATALLELVRELAGNLISEHEGKGDVKVDFDAAGLSFEVTGADGKPVETRSVIEKTVADLLRMAGIRVREKVVEEDNQPRRELYVAISAGTGARARQRIRKLCRLASRVWEKLERLPADSRELELHQLIELTVEEFERFRERDVRRALVLLASLKLTYTTEPLLPMSYVLAIHDKDKPLLAHEYQGILDELKEVNRMAELRGHAMEVFVRLPPEARDGFIKGYFGVQSAEKMDLFLEEQLRGLDDDGDGKSGFIAEKLKQIRSQGVEDLFARYREKDAPEPNQWKAISYPYDRHLMVNAGPGAGKTSVLLARVAYLIHVQRVPPEQILVLAFNRAVVFEIRSGIRELFRKMGYAAYVRRTRIYTFHALATRFMGRMDDDKDKDILSVFSDRLRKEPALATEAAAGVRVILVDEFQDTAESRYSIINSIREISGASVMVIGDDDQDILRWERYQHGLRGEKLESTSYFRSMEKSLGLSADSTLTLRVNFRSGSEVVERSQSILKKFFDRDTGSGARLKASVELRAAPANLPSVVRDNQGVVSKDEARGWAIKEAERMLAESAETGESVALLCRTNAEVAEIYQRLKPFHPRLTIQNSSNVYYIHGLRSVGCLLDLCRERMRSEGDRPLDDGLWKDIERAWTDLTIPETEASLDKDVDPATLWSLVKRECSYPHISDLINFIEELKSDELRRITGRVSGSGCAIVSTINKVKGLEFDGVIVIPSDSNFPYGKDIDVGGAAAEEVRLFYVGMTRAKTRLVFGFGNREWAWWNKEHWKSASTDRRTILEGSLEGEVWISWAAYRDVDGASVQDYIEKYVRVGDPVIVVGRDILHQTGGTRTKIGVLQKKYKGGKGSELSIAAVYRLPQDPEGEYFLRLIDAVQQRGWSYVVLVAGVL